MGRFWRVCRRLVKKGINYNLILFESMYFSNCFTFLEALENLTRILLKMSGLEKSLCKRFSPTSFWRITSRMETNAVGTGGKGLTFGRFLFGLKKKEKITI